MRCKPGDIAVVVRNDSIPENVGVLLRVLHADEKVGFWVCECMSWATTYHEGALYRKPPGHKGRIRDSYLRPLRNDPDTDEVIRIAGKPLREEA